ncbi:MAG: T9SS type A sorting domain-containing protein [Bacteroidia bacterium]
MLLICYQCGLNAQPITFIKNYEASGQLGRAWAQAKSFNNGFIISGGGIDSSGNPYRCLIRLDSLGNFQWSKHYDNDQVGAFSIISYNSLKYLQGGLGHYLLSNGLSPANLTMFDTTGDILWSKNYTDSVHALSILSTDRCKNSNEIISLGSSYDVNSLNFKIFLLKSDFAGNIIWSKEYYTTNFNGDPKKLIITFDGNFLIYGISNSGGMSFLIKTDTSGTILWSRAYCLNGGGTDYLKETGDKGFILTGSGIGVYNMFLMKMDSMGIIQWVKTYLTPMGCRGECLDITTDKGYIIAGLTGNVDTLGGSGEGCFLVKTDSLGNMQWCTNPGGIGPGFWPRLVTQVYDGGFFVRADISNVLTLSIMKTDSSGHIGTCYELPVTTVVANAICTDSNINFTVTPLQLYIAIPTINTHPGGVFTTVCDPVGVEEIKKEETEIRVYPNPFNSRLRVGNWKLEVGEKAEIKIYDLMGELVFEKELSSNQTEEVLNLSFLQQGVYFLNLKSNGGSYTKKVVKL